MSLTSEDVAKIARLSRIRLNDQEKENMKEKLNNILHWIEQLQQVDTTNVAAFSDLLDQEMPEREDVVMDGGKLDLLMKNAPESAHGMFAVPKVVE